VRLIPYARLTLRTDASPDAVEAKLAKLVTENRGFSADPIHTAFFTTFFGSFKRKHFKFYLASDPTGARRDPRPIVVGDIVPGFGGTEVRVVVRPTMLDAALTLGIFGLCLQVFRLGVRDGLRNGFGAETVFGLVVGVAVMVGLYVLRNRVFWRRADEARIALRDGLGCHEVEPEPAGEDRLLRR
jgi:hypothetical protein